MKDKKLTCVQCQSEFLVTGEEREKMLARGFGMPRRCPNCRKHKAKIIPGGKEEWRQKEKKRDGRGLKRYWGEDVNEW